RCLAPRLGPTPGLPGMRAMRALLYGSRSVQLPKSQTTAPDKKAPDRLARGVDSGRSFRCASQRQRTHGSVDQSEQAVLAGAWDYQRRFAPLLRRGFKLPVAS